MKRSHLILAFAHWDPAENIIVLISVRMKKLLKEKWLKYYFGGNDFPFILQGSKITSHYL